jgi:hypothetical protein
VLQERWSTDGFEVGFLAENQKPVGDVPDRGYHVAAQPRDLAW